MQSPSDATRPRQQIRVNGYNLTLPAGVTVADWALERTRNQNPRIRAFLVGIRQLGEVMESNYAILHCSPERLGEIWQRVRKVAGLMRKELAPLLEATSCIPQLEASRRSAAESLRMLDHTVLKQLDRFQEVPPQERLLEVRKLLCVSIGQLHAFLQDTFGQLMAGDPRSTHDADYYLSKRFPQDIDEAEWLYATVGKLGRYLQALDHRRLASMRPLADLLRQRELPDLATWTDGRRFLGELSDELTPRLKEILALRGIRFHEMEILDRYAVDLPMHARMVIEIRDTAMAFASRIDDPESLRGLHRVACRRLLALVGEIDVRLRDLVAFVPLWIEGIERRRALLLRRALAGDGNGDTADRDIYDSELAGDDTARRQAGTDTEAEADAAVDTAAGAEQDADPAGEDRGRDPVTRPLELDTKQRAQLRRPRRS